MKKTKTFINEDDPKTREIILLQTRIEALLYALHLSQLHNQSLQDKIFKMRKESVALGE